MNYVVEYDYYSYPLNKQFKVVDQDKCEHRLFRRMREWLKKQPKSCVNFMSLKNLTAESHAIMYPEYKYCTIRKIIK